MKNYWLDRANPKGISLRFTPEQIQQIKRYQIIGTPLYSDCRLAINIGNSSCVALKGTSLRFTPEQIQHIKARYLKHIRDRGCKGAK